MFSFLRKNSLPVAYGIFYSMNANAAAGSLASVMQSPTIATVVQFACGVVALKKIGEMWEKGFDFSSAIQVGLLIWLSTSGYNTVLQWFG